MTQPNQNETIEKAGQLLQDGYHCSEAMVISLGVYFFGAVNPEWVKISNPFAGGLAGTQHEVCGALTGGMMVIGLLHGRTTSQQDDTTCLRLAETFQQAFKEHFGHARCCDLRRNKYGSAPGHTPCRVLVSQTARILLDVLENNSNHID